MQKRGSMREKRQKKKKNGILLRLSKILKFCLFIIIPTLVLLFISRLETVIVEGSNRYTSEELQKKVLTKKTDENTLLLYLRYKYGETESIPFIERVDIEMENLNTVRIQVYEKVITGCIEYMGGYMYFDKDGVIVESSDKKLDQVPFITGLSFNKMVLYEKLDTQKEEIFDVILNLTQLIKKYELDVETIQFNSDMEVTLYCGDIQVLLGKRNTYDEQIAELKNLLPKAPKEKLTLDMKNFTEGQKRIIAKPRK